ncbi:uncharacterized protein IL334_006506 [Kwoniella shivajii]|uniref:Uncharacterized protein n=1 Tax=Kwoniella shivajii TaxID=564305 RepID=A0ABZ1D652_9TREE|nr:hypothetical protein IL334_006506 [Kwoniella shivajii]
MLKIQLTAFLTLLLLVLVNAQSTRTRIEPVPRRNDLLTSRTLRRSLCRTNAECLRKGLPLLRPAKRSSTTTHALKPRQSADSTTQTGTIQAFNTDGNSIGYVSRNLNPGGGYDLTTSSDDAISLSFSSDGTSTDPFDIVISSDDRQGNFPYLGFAFNGSPANMGTDSSKFALLVGVSASNAGPPLESDDGSTNTETLYGGVETTVFLYNSATQTLTSRWSNTDGNKVDTIFFYASESDYGFGIVAPDNYAAFKQDFDVNQQIVTFKFVDIPTKT